MVTSVKDNRGEQDWSSRLWPLFGGPSFNCFVSTRWSSSKSAKIVYYTWDKKTCYIQVIHTILNLVI